MKKFLRILAFATVLVAMSCNHKDLCYHHRDHAHRYHINVIADYRYDWEENFGGPDWKQQWPEGYLPYDELRPTKPAGLRVINYNEAGEHNINNVSADGGIVNLYEGYNDLLFHNNDAEYIVFSRVDNSVYTRATTRTRTRTSYMGSEYANEGEETINAPDMLYANYYEDYYVEKRLEPTDVEVTLQPMVFTYKVRYEFKSGLEYVALARGALSGMARSVLLNTGDTSEEAATILYDAIVTDYGVGALVNSFGVPNFPNPNFPSTRADNRHALNLEVLLKNGNLLNFDFDVTDQVKAQPHGGVIVVKDIVINEEDGRTGTGAFDVEVNDWGDYKDIDLPL